MERTRTGRATRTAGASTSPLTYSLSESSRVTIVIAQPTSGRKVGTACIAPTRSNRRNHLCTRYVTVGTLKRRAPQGLNKVAFTGRIGRRALKPGGYGASATAKDAAFNVSKVSTASFTIASR
jgi:virginiamycin B lyase